MPNSNYCAFEDWVVPILDQLVAEQDGPNGERWSPSKVIARLGKEINNEESVYYWCYKVGPVPAVFARHLPSSTISCSSVMIHCTQLALRDRSLTCSQNDIPVFCPALTDGSLGDMIYFHTYKTDKQLNIDIVQDIRRLNDMSVKAKQAGMIILGGGVCKHQIANAMLFVRLPGSWSRRVVLLV